MKKSMSAALIILAVCTLGSAHAQTVNNGGGLITGYSANVSSKPTNPALSKVVFSDNFDRRKLDPAWTVGFDNVTGWSYILSDSSLRVTDIAVSDGANWGAVNLSRHVKPIGDFSLTFDFSWESIHDVIDVQNVMVQLYDNNGMIATVGYSDGRIGSSGGRYARIGGNVHEEVAADRPIDGSAHVQVLRSGNDISILWDGELLLSGTGSTPVTRIDLVFSHNPDLNGLFGNEWVDLIEVQTVR